MSQQPVISKVGICGYRCLTVLMKVSPHISSLQMSLVDEIELLSGFEQFYGVHPARHGLAFVTLGLEDPSHDFSHRFFVIDNQNALAHARHYGTGASVK